MLSRYSLIVKVRFYVKIAAIYLLTMAFMWSIVKPLSPLYHSHSVAVTQSAQRPYTPRASATLVISGRPVRLVIPSSSLDLVINPGYYDSLTHSWTLSGYYAQFAMMSTLANNVTGETFIYGHNNDFVFGALRHQTPAPNAQALLYTDNGHIFDYTFQSVKSLGPNDTSILSYSGPPILMIQTCTGSLNEYRTEYTFVFSKVIQ